MRTLAPASRARREASLGSFLRWAYRQDLITANPMDRLDRVHLEPPPPRGVPRTQVEQILAAIPRDRARDRLLFRLLAETGLGSARRSAYTSTTSISPSTTNTSA